MIKKTAFLIFIVICLNCIVVFAGDIPANNEKFTAIVSKKDTEEDIQPEKEQRLNLVTVLLIIGGIIYVTFYRSYKKYKK